ncbi:tRNA (adenosine(37)-N6)-threonylcarbamoyltransferase complex dimerization subunit type 1 TsaB [Actinomyces trachealis]|uniref:tRNA (adenosine(37)-N6)-threonylcarbamoyltransferase complex dimerization subunit type 1 TsaB n=1 Tax=Actinomyces trachealis TaxID=2763540 RepID=UPI0018C826BB|nr:tRNA (adenosine(37)-N6)-threonylcarbamoyltransferase complex dimerization subunit type 1 TsaB [Actinomyces trachealis]
MRIVSIDSSLGTQLLACDAEQAPAGGSVKLTVLAHSEQVDSRRHAESLGPMLASILGQAEVAEFPLDAVVAATGPAPFTGLRAGLVAARVLGRTRSVPVHGVPSLDAVARLALDELPEGATVLVATDARRKEVYAARYLAAGADDVERLDDFLVAAPEAALELGQADAVAGSGVTLHPVLAQGRKELAPVSGDTLTQVRVALARLAQAPAGTILDAEPLYLRHADVQVPTRRKRAL